MSKENPMKRTNTIHEEKEISNQTVSPEPKKMKRKLHLSYTAKIISHAFFIIIFAISFFLFLFLAISITKNEIVHYRERSNVDYKVYLDENDFYDTPYLKKDMAYVASLIDHIYIHYHYEFDITKKIDCDVQHQIKAKLIIQSQNNKNAFYEKEYDLTESVQEEVKKRKQYSIDEDIEIDYAYYNNLANKFRSNYAVNTNSYLEVYLEVDKDIEQYQVNKNSKAVLIIPLSEQEVSIRLNDKGVDEEQKMVSPAKLKIRSYPFLMISLIPFIMMSITMNNLWEIVFHSIKKRSNYDRYISRILRGYDRIIVNVKTAPKLEDYKIIEVESIEELIDVRDNTKQPIKYFIIEEHRKSEFFVTNDKDLYLYVVQATRFNKDRKDENI